jgi:2,4-dienoyl-CoA reductase-like NADH-dependent reductase (Old Yellow Enzyme family)/thioredoxin reductase
MSLTHVHTALQIKSLRLRNRVFRSAHATGLGVMGLSNDFVEYHAARARGGVALSFLEILSVHPSSPGFLPTYDSPGLADGYARLVERIRPLGMALFQQLWHGGHNAIRYDGGVTWSASNIPSPYWSGSPPLPMTKTMIDEVVKGFAESARFVEKCGIQGAEVHAGHNYLVQQFLEPATNKREDDYGGTLENRARFLIEILTAIRAAVNADFVLGIRIGDSLIGGSADAQNLGKVVRMLEQRELIDFINVTHAGYYALHECMAGMDQPVGHQLPRNSAIRRGASVPVMVIGRFRTLEEADQVIRAGDADMVGMTRATIADPDLVVKSLAGRAQEVRPCIGCSQDCIGGVMTTHRIGCVVNAAVSQEATLSENLIISSTDPRRVVIVGGGPAGMEAARVAALRGHHAILFEAEPKLGGAIKYAARAPARTGIADITTWLEAEVFRLGVDVRLSSYVDAQDLLALNADAYIVATGSSPRVDGVLASNPDAPILGMNKMHVKSSYDVLGSPPPSRGTRAVVVDDIGHYEPIAVAEFLMAAGVHLTMITRNNCFAKYLENTFLNEGHLIRLNKTGLFSLLTRTRVLEVTDQGVRATLTYSHPEKDESFVVLAETIVVVTANAPNSDLWVELQQKGVEAIPVGDALSPRYLGAAIRDGNMAARSIPSTVIPVHCGDAHLYAHDERAIQVTA